MSVDIFICWQVGTDDMLSACLNGIMRHTRKCDTDYSIHCVSMPEEGKEYRAFKPTCQLRYIGEIDFIDLERQDKTPTKVHGHMLDSVLPSRATADYVLTLDSDCIPVADGWLEDLIGMLENGTTLAGILHPWAPPPPDLPHKKIEWRVRSQHCWETTHVACQLIRRTDLTLLFEKGFSYNGGDDTGLLLPKMVKENGGKVDGFKPTRCPVVWEGDMDPEFNRYSCIVYGDKVYHHGGFSRGRLHGDEAVFVKSFGWCEKLVLWGHGAEFLLDDRFSYRFKFDREEDVAKEKMQRLFGLNSQKMLG